MDQIDLLTINGLVAKDIILETKRSGSFKMPCGTEIIYLRTKTNWMTITDTFVLSIDQKQSGEVSGTFLRQVLTSWLDSQSIILQFPLPQFFLYQHHSQPVQSQLNKLPALAPR